MRYILCYVYNTALPASLERLTMARVIHARLDDDIEKLLEKLQRQSGWSDSQVVREGIKALTVMLGPKGKRIIVGAGRFRSGVSDLGSNKRHLRGFGR